MVRKMVTASEILIVVFLTILAVYYWFKSVTTIREKLREAKALSPETAVKPVDAGVPWWCGLHLELVAEKTNDNRYYLKEKRCSS